MIQTFSEQRRIFIAQQKPGSSQLEPTTDRILSLTDRELFPIPLRWTTLGRLTSITEYIAAPYVNRIVWKEFWVARVLSIYYGNLCNDIFVDLAVRVAKIKQTAKNLTPDELYNELAAQSSDYLSPDLLFPKELAEIRKDFLRRMDREVLIQAGQHYKVDGTTNHFVERVNTAIHAVIKLHELGIEKVRQTDKNKKAFIAKCEQILDSVGADTSVNTEELAEVACIKAFEALNEKEKVIEATFGEKGLAVVEVAEGVVKRISDDLLPPIREAFQNTSTYQAVVKKINGIDPQYLKVLENILPIAKAVFEIINFGMQATANSTLRMKGMIREVLREELVPVLKNQKIMIERLNEITGMLSTIAKNQVAIEEKLIIVSRQVAAMHREVLGKLKEINSKMVLLNEKTGALIKQSAKYCAEARSKLLEFEGYSPQVNRFACYEAMQLFYLQESYPLLRKGLKELPGLLMKPGRNDEPLRHGVKRSADINFLRNIVSYYLKIPTIRKKKKNVQLAYLLFAPKNIRELNNHTLEDPLNKERLPQELYDRFSSTFASLTSHPYDLNLLESLCQSAVTFHYFYDMIDPISRAMISKEELKTKKTSVMGKSLLLDALARIEIGIIQTNLLAGSGIIPLLYEEQDKEKLSEILAPNPLLAANYLNYSIHKTLEKKGIPITSYQMACSSQKESDLINFCMQHPWPLNYDKKEKVWRITFQKKYKPIALPKPKTVLNGDLELHPSSIKLQIVREKIIHELAGYYSQTNESSYEKGLEIVRQYIYQPGEKYGRINAKH
ncbi:MAG: hypothetical protein ChlgKO_02570 [Chlamydiales bacterium]